MNAEISASLEFFKSDVIFVPLISALCIARFDFVTLMRRPFLMKNFIVYRETKPLSELFPFLFMLFEEMLKINFLEKEENLSSIRHFARVKVVSTF